jgi:phospholipase C
MKRFAWIVGSLFALSSAHADMTRLYPQKVQYPPEQVAAAQKVKYLIIVYQENWSFDSLYGKFPGVDGLANAKPENTIQVDQKGVPYPSLPVSINDSKKPYSEIPADLPNAPFDLQPYIPWSKNTGDLVHQFYQEQEQISGGKMNAFAAFSDAGGFVMSYYDIRNTRMGKLSQQFTICDQFFHSCYGCSMCSVLWLFAAQMPVWPQAPKNIVAQIDPNGVLIKDGLVSPDGYAINDAQPFYPPFKAGTPDAQRVPPQTYRTIGDLLSEKGISWGWYAQGWDDALKGKPPPLFPYHHQAPSYFKQFAPGTKAREKHLFDLSRFYQQLDAGNIPSVCFIRSTDMFSQHPGDNALYPGLEWCADFIERVQRSAIWKDCAIIVTYDENGGRWDHVPPPIVDQFGPGTRIPTVIISPYAKRGFVDPTSYETVSILKFIEERWGLPSLSSRDAQANNLLNAFDFNQGE